MECLFGTGDGFSEPWHAYHLCTCKELNQGTIDFLAATAGVHGTWHDTHGWLLDMSLWTALLKYIQWCDEQQLDFKYQMEQVLNDDLYYVRLVEKKLEEFGA